jgi:hypothetical protein
MRSRGVWVATTVSAVFAGFFAACSSGDDTTSDSVDGAVSNDDGSIGADGSIDGTLLADGGQPPTDGSIATDSGTPDAMKLPDGGTCTPRVGGPFICGSKNCDDSTTQYCIYGAVPNTCESLPVECQCEETFTCACLTDNLICDDGGAKGVCTPHGDAGEIENIDASAVNFFWLIAHTCHPR